jgi:peptide/nickel transport system permease protein
MSESVTLQSATSIPALDEVQHNEGYFELVWRRFRRSKASIAGGLMVITLGMLAIFAEFFAPYSLSAINLNDAFMPPQRVRLIDAEGNFHLRPFVYEYAMELNMTTFQVTWSEDTSVIYPIRFFVEGSEYKLLGLIPTNIHLYGVEGARIHILGTDKMGRDLWSKACEAGRISLSMSLFGAIISIALGSVIGVTSGYYGGAIDNGMQRFVEFVNAFPQLPLWMALAAIIPKTMDSFSVFLIMAFIFAMLSWTTLAREVRGKVLALRETDFVLSAKEMGASDARIIFRHLYPNTLSHTIVILTLTIPTVILAEAFLSFLGIGIQEPLISWGLMMRNAQDIQILGQAVWILSPVGFIVVSVLGFNFLGDGLRDAADPYASM